MKDSIDFGKENIPKLFRKIFIPTVLGMAFSALFQITDGIFVGQGIGSLALAAINITAPIFLITTGIALMFGIGASVVCSIHYAKGKIKTARINMTISILASFLLLSLISLFILVFPEFTLSLLGCSSELLPSAKSYIYGFVPFLSIFALLCSSGFFIRLDGSPKYAMLASLIGTSCNIFLDYLFIFVFKQGLFGAAIASGIGSSIGALFGFIYICIPSHTFHLAKIKLSFKSFLLSMRNTIYICRLGFPVLLGELSISCLILTGNYVFMNLAGEPGVAAYSVICYLSPVVFMLYASIGQTAQPIISYNYGANNMDRSKRAFIVAMKMAISFGIISMTIAFLASPSIVKAMILPDDPAYKLAVRGLSLFSIGFIPFGINVVCINYLQSTAKMNVATIFTIIRGFILTILAFIILAKIGKIDGAFLAVPAAESLSVILFLLWKKFFKRPLTNCQ